MTAQPLATQLAHRSRRLAPVRANVERALGGGPLCLKHLVTIADADYRTVLWFLLVAEREGRLEQHRGAVALARPGGDGRGAERCRLCDERAGADRNGHADLAELVERMRLTPSLFYGQRGVTVETVLRRCDYMTERGDVEDRRIVFLGDNDYQSVALALLARPRRVLVLDIDRRVLANVARAASEHDLEIETRHHDLYEELPADLLGAFDVFVFDPYPTPDASFEAMVIANGLELLDRDTIGAGYTFALPTHKFRQNFLGLQRVVTAAGLVVTDVVPRLAEFLPIAGELIADEAHWVERLGGLERSISHTKSLLRFETTEVTRAPQAQADAAPYDGTAARRQELVRAMGTHYLLHAVGLQAQKDLVLETAIDREEWRAAFTAVEPERQADTMPVHRLLEEIVGAPLAETDVERLLDESERGTLRGLAAESGYDVSEEEARALEVMARAGYGGLSEAGLAADVGVRALYLAARVFSSYFRGAG